MSPNTKHLVAAVVLWVLVSIVGVTLVRDWDVFPVVGSSQAADVDAAFTLLMMLSVPVLALVVVFLLYSAVVFRRPGRQDEDGPNVSGHRGVHWAWLIASTALTVYVIYNPGLTGLSELNEDHDVDLVVEVTAEQWRWNFTFPEYGVELEKAREITLPANQRIQFDITSDDVIHSLWLPLFRMKQDAVPGRVTTMFVDTGDPMEYAQDPNIRIQCAEICGTGHARMLTRLSVVEQQEFQDVMASLSTDSQRAKSVDVELNDVVQESTR